MKNYPTALYPTIVSGKIWGPVIRFESLDGSVLEESIPNGVMVFKNFAPFERNGKTWGVPHAQKWCKRGWLHMNPGGWHAWYFDKIQTRNSEGLWLPRTEKGLYVRRPFTWRWDVPGTMVDGQLRHWIWTKGYLGGHWD
jgi:hypothetical protein